MYSDPIIFSLPLRFWLGIVLGILLLLQYLTGMKILKWGFSVHRVFLPILISLIGVVHLVIGFMIYLGN